jgi:uncharacterized integral membrane protein
LYHGFQGWEALLTFAYKRLKYRHSAFIFEHFLDYNSEGRCYMKLFLFLALLISVAIIVFTAQNQAEIPLTFMSWEFSKPIPVIFAVPFFVGVIAGASLVVPLWMKKSKTAKSQKRRIHELEDEMAAKTEQEKEDTVEVEKQGEDGAEESVSQEQSLTSSDKVV